MSTGRREQKRAAAHQRIVAAAARAIRAHGPDGVSVSQVMGEAGLTHGAFYAYFPNKEALVAEALVLAQSEFKAWLSEQAGDGTARERFVGMGEAYLSRAHLENRANGCQIAALGPELSRHGGPLAETLGHSVDGIVQMLEGLIAEGFGDDPFNDEDARIALAVTVGGIVTARALNNPDDADKTLQACVNALYRLFGPRLAGEPVSRDEPGAHGATPNSTPSPKGD